MVNMEREDLLRLLATIRDPEVPALNIVEMGIVRDAAFQDGVARVAVTPTYIGCPALDWIKNEIRRVLRAAGAVRVEVETVLKPAWTTDGWSDETREKLRRHGVAPPAAGGTEPAHPLDPAEEERVACPYCGSTETELRSRFGCTPCLALRYCLHCAQPFEHFKRI